MSGPWFNLPSTYVAFSERKLSWAIPRGALPEWRGTSRRDRPGNLYRTPLSCCPNELRRGVPSGLAESCKGPNILPAFPGSWCEADPPLSTSGRKLVFPRTALPNHAETMRPQFWSEAPRSLVQLMNRLVQLELKLSYTAWMGGRPLPSNRCPWAGKDVRPMTHPGEAVCRTPFLRCHFEGGWRRGTSVARVGGMPKSGDLVMDLWEEWWSPLMKGVMAPRQEPFGKNHSSRRLRVGSSGGDHSKLSSSITLDRTWNSSASMPVLVALGCADGRRVGSWDELDSSSASEASRDNVGYAVHVVTLAPTKRDQIARSRRGTLVKVSEEGARNLSMRRKWGTRGLSRRGLPCLQAPSSSAPLLFPHKFLKRKLTASTERQERSLQWGHSALSPAHTVRFWPRFGHLGQILKILKDSCNPRLKSVVFDRWFDMSTGSRLMAVAINFFLRLNSGSVRRFQTLSCSVTSPTTTVKPRTNRCAEPDDAISATTSNHENVETSQVDSTTGRKTYWAM